MLLSVLFFQFLLPFALIIAMAIPIRSSKILMLQFASSLIYLLALWPIGVWIIPRRWALPVFVVLLTTAFASQFWRKRIVSSERSWKGPLKATLFLVLGLYSIYTLLQAFRASDLPTGPIAVLEWPLGPGRYLVLNGGANLQTNSHADALDQSVPGHRDYWGTSYGVDFVAVNVMGFRARGIQPKDPAAYFIFGATILTPCNGKVIKAIDGRPDMNPPTYDLKNLEGNHVILDCDGFHVLLAHMKKDSVQVRTGETVQIGRVLGQVGNSGGTDEPHLHIHAQKPGSEAAPFSGHPLPILFQKQFLLRNELIHIPSLEPGVSDRSD